MDVFLIIILLTWFSELTCAGVLLNLYNRDPFNNTKIRDTALGLIVHSILPLSSISELLSEKYISIVLISAKIGAFCGILGISIVVYKLTYHFHEKFVLRYITRYFKIRVDYAYISIMSLVAVLGTIFLKVRYEDGFWLYNRGPFYIEMLIYLGGTLLFVELTHSFYLVSKASPKKYKYIFLSYPLAWATALVLFVLQQNVFLSIPNYVYQFPNLIGHVMFIIALSLPISVLLIPPKGLKKEVLQSVNISPSSGIVIIDENYDIQFINSYFSNYTGLSYDVYQQNFLELFKNSEIYESSEGIFDLPRILQLPCFIIELIFSKQMASRLRFEKILDPRLPSGTIIVTRVSELKALESDIKILKQQLFDAKEISINAETISLFVKSVAHDLGNALINFESIEYLFNSGIRNRSIADIESAMPYFIQGYNHLKEHVDYLWRMDDDSEKEIIDVGDLLKKSISLVQWPIGTNRILNIDQNYSLKCLMNDLVFKKIVINILNNARDALVISNKNEKLIKVEANTIKLPNNSTDKKYVHITISNNGPKIGDKDIIKIFKRGYSSKFGSNKGIGLSICKDLVDKNNGQITVKSTNQLTTFELTFPQILT